jgi:ferric-dicitrate binding protein FerR (iron transport regulator)
MEKNREYIRNLLFDKIGGTISEEENELVENAIRNDDVIAAMWQEIQLEFAHPQRMFLAGLEEDKGWENVKAGLKPGGDKNVRLFYRRSLQLVAAVFILGIAGVYYYFTLRPSAKVTARQELNQKDSTAVPAMLALKLSDGTMIDLSKAGRQVQAGDMRLSLGNKQLSYVGGNDRVNQWAVLEVPKKLDYQLLLPDGSRVWLNASSSVRFPYVFSGATREVFLEGEGYFEVSKDAAHPFIVHAGATAVRVLGTSFNINTYKRDKPVTSLVEGAVMVAANTDSVRLGPGHQAVYTGNSLATAPFDTEEVLSWMKGIYYFRNTRLRDICDILSRWYDVKVVVEDPALLDQTFSGAVNKHKPLQVFLTNITVSSGIKVNTAADGTIYLK